MNFFITFPSIPCAVLLVIGSIARWFLVPSDRKRTEWLLVASTLAWPAAAVSEAIAGSLSHLRPLKYDQYIYVLDALFGQPSFVLGRVVYRSTLLMDLVSVSYGLLSIMIVIAFAASLWLRPVQETIALTKAFLLNLFLALPLYLLIPVCGPEFAFPGFPSTQPAHLTPQPIPIAAAPNGIPSVHTSSALLVLWFLRHWQWGRLIGAIFLALTVLATLGSGQHYLIDLFSAVPYAIAIVFLTRISPVRAHDEMNTVSATP